MLRRASTKKVVTFDLSDTEDMSSSSSESHSLPHCEWQCRQGEDHGIRGERGAWGVPTGSQCLEQALSNAWEE